MKLILKCMNISLKRRNFYTFCTMNYENHLDSSKVIEKTDFRIFDLKKSNFHPNKVEPRLSRLS